MGHAVHQAEADVGVGHAVDVSGQAHRLDGVRIAVGGGPQVRGDHLDGAQAQGVAQLPGTGGDVALDGVRQGVQSGGHLEGAGHRVHEIGIDDGDHRDVVRIDAHELPLIRRVGDDVVDRGLRRRPGGGGHADDGHPRVLRGRQALQAQDVLEFGVGGDHRDGLARVLRGAAAQTDEDLGAGCAEGGQARLDLLNGRIGGDVGEDLPGDAGGIEKVGDARGRAVVGQDRVGDDECPGQAAACDLLGNGGNRATTEVAGLVEDHAVGHEDAPGGGRAGATGPDVSDSPE